MAEFARHYNPAQEMLSDFLDANIPAFLWGDPGIGKSAMVADETARRGWGLIDIRLSMRESVDLRGIPLADKEAGVTRWLAPDELPRADRDGENGVILFDEINAGVSPSTLVACYQMFHDRKLGEWKAPSGWRMVGAGNKLTNKAVAMRIPTPLANRGGHIDVELDHTAWYHWAESNLVDPLLIGFLRYRRELLYKMPEEQPREFCSPRSWTLANKFMRLPRERRMANVGALVGPQGAAELEAYLDIAGQLEPVERILANPTGAAVPPLDKIGALYAVTMAVAYAVDKRTMKAGTQYAMRLPPEFTALFAQVIFVRDKSLASYGVADLLAARDASSRIVR